jgi:ribonuclease HII
MARAVTGLGVAPDLVVVDGLDVIPGVPFAQEAVVDGDARLLSIAAASGAREGRARPDHGADSIACIPTTASRSTRAMARRSILAALDRRGPCALHRYSFTPVCVQELPFE